MKNKMIPYGRGEFTGAHIPGHWERKRWVDLVNKKREELNFIEFARWWDKNGVPQNEVARKL